MNIKSALLKILIAILLAIAAALLMSIFFLTLALLLLIMQNCADTLGYRLIVSDEVQKTVIAIGGALGVSLIALYGVHRQNMSAERRHKVDSSLALRKEIFLQVAETGASQITYLMSLGSTETTEMDRKKTMAEASLAFSKLQMVASKETIGAMLDANEEWTRAMFDIRLMPSVEEGEELKRLSEIQKRATPFMQKLWLFNLIARKEIESAFDDNDAYFSMMGEKYSHLTKFFEELEQKINLPDLEKGRF